MIGIYKKLYRLLSARERIFAGLIFLFLLFSAFIEIIGVTSIMPFMALVSNPETINSNRYLHFLYQYFEFNDPRQFLFLIGVLVFIALVASLSCKAFGFYLQIKFTSTRQHALSLRLMNIYLRQPYEWYLGQHSSDMITGVLSHSSRVVNDTLFPALQVIANALVVAALFSVIVIVDPMLAACTALLIGGAYMITFLLAKRRLVSIGKRQFLVNEARVKTVHETFGGIKEIKVFDIEDIALERYRMPSQIFARLGITAKMISELPSFAMQGLVFGGIIATMLYLMSSKGSIEAALPTLALYALAGYRLMPAAQALYKQLSELRVAEPILDSLHKQISELEKYAQTPNDKRATSPVKLQESLVLNNIQYSYPSSSKSALENLNIKIPAKTTVGFVGSSGSGKSTTVDIILGLLRPQSGEMMVDGITICKENASSWRENIGYVPQQIFLSDGTIAENIAFGCSPDTIDFGAVERAARAASLHDFITTDLPLGYETLVGERGVRLSGGQRQRIGIARALYKDPDVLIFDEATSALDNITEISVMEAIRILGSKKTVILIAHRLSTIRDCGQIILFENGQAIANGTYTQLQASSPEFSALTKIALSEKTLSDGSEIT